MSEFKGEQYVSRKTGRRKRGITFQASPGDEEIIQQIRDHLCVQQGEAIRTAIRVYAALLKKP